MSGYACIHQKLRLTKIRNHSRQSVSHVLFRNRLERLRSGVVTI